MSYTLTETQTVAFDQAISGEKRVIVFGGAIRGGKTYWLLITISQLAITRKLCIDQETMQTEQWLVNALTQSSHFEQRGNVLELRHDGAMQVSLRKK